MRWLLAKDLRVLARSPLLVGLLVLYPVLVSALIGFALSRGPEKPRVALVNQVATGTGQIELGGQTIDTARLGTDFLSSVDAVAVGSREEARALVEDGQVLGAIVIPAEVTQRLQSGLQPAVIEVLYNAEDPVKARYLDDLVKSRVQDANTQLTRAFSGLALEYLDLLLRGGQVSFLGRQANVLGLERSEQILRDAQADLPARSPVRAELDQVIRFAGGARQNLGLADEALASVGTPIRVRTEVVEGGGTPLGAFAVAVAVTVTLMFVTLLLASGILALEREENVFRRLVRGLVSRTGLVVEKVGLAALCSALVALAMLMGLALFVELDLSRAGHWSLVLAAGALAFGAMGVAIGALSREVRAASLLAFMVSLPIAFLALVPSGAVSGGLYTAIEVVSALFPFRPTLDALQAALGDGGSMAGPLAHLAALTLGFGLVGRLAVGRLA